MKYVLTLLTVWASLSAQAQTWPGWRLRSFGLERYDNIAAAYKPADSAVYYYSGNRTGKPTFAWLEGILRSEDYRDMLYEIAPALQYDSVQTYRGSAQGGYSNANITFTQTLNNTLITGRARLSSGNITAQETYTYNGNLLTEAIAGGKKREYQYNSNNLSDTIEHYVFSSPTQTWVLAQTQFLAYNSSNQLETSRTIQALAPQYYTDHHYTYTTNGLPETIIEITGSSQPGDTFSSRTFTYTTSGDLETELQQRNNSVTGLLENYDRHWHTYDSKHNRLQDHTYTWNKSLQQWDTTSRWTYTYTSEGLPTTFESLNWDSPGQAWVPGEGNEDYRTSHRMRLHYDIVWPVNITEQQHGYTTIQLYPNPAGEILTFRISMETAQPFTATITDMQGRVLMQWKEAAAKEYTRTIPTAALPAGTYVLRVDGDGLKQTKMFSVR